MFNNYHVNCLVFLLVLFCVKLQAATETFEQAYAPIDVSGITIFIPIELKPEPSVVVSLKETQDNYIVEWSKVNDATRYKIEQKINGVWVVLDTHVTSNRYQVNKGSGSQFRITSCHRYGCASAKAPNNFVDMPLFINQFSADKTAYQGNESAQVSWHVQGASNITLTSSTGARYTNLALKGSVNLPVHSITKATLSVSGFGKQQNQHISLAKAAPQLEQKPVSESGYIQPLKDLKIKAVERTITPFFERNKDDSIFVASTQNTLYKVAFNNSDSRIAWHRNLAGMVVNKPLIHNNALYYSVSLMNGRGQVCKTSINNTEHKCIDVNQSVIAAPVLLNELGFFGNERLFVFSTKGNVYELTNNLMIKQSLELPVDLKRYPLLTTPVADNMKQQIILRDSPNSLAAIEIQSPSDVLSQSLQTVRNFFSTETASQKAHNHLTNGQGITVKWKNTLEEEK